jgi:flagellar basal body rod protein FlgC
VAGLGGGTAATVRAVTPACVLAFDPSAPYADSHGMVASPNADFIQQIIARYSFAANAQAVRTDAQMMATPLDIAA